MQNLLSQQIVLTQKELDLIDLNDPEVRKVLRRGLAGFSLLYLSHYFTLPFADFHRELIHVLEDPQYDLAAITGFRGSAKSTFSSLALPLWAALEGLHPFIILLADTGTQMTLNVQNLKQELETNPLILADYGVQFESSKNWSNSQLLLANGTLIMGRARGMKIRGLRHRQHRPSLVVGDDLEDLSWVQQKANRDKTERWLNAEVIPAVQEDKSKLVIIGNLLHNDALMARLHGNTLFKSLKFPLIDDDGACTWEAKYPTPASLTKQRRKVGETAWAREYLLKIVSEDDQIIKESDITYYEPSILNERDDRGNLLLKIKDAGEGTDLAISEKQSADCTASVGGYVVKLDDRDRILVLPDPMNERVDFATGQKRLVQRANKLPAGAKFYIEDVGFQKAALEGARLAGLSVYPMRPVGDKRARLQSVAPYIKDGTVMFARRGCEDLIAQLINFGIEAHDDLVDALVYLILGLMHRKTGTVVVGRADAL